MLQDSRSFQETFWNTGCRKLIVRTGAGAVYWKARDKSGLACRSHAARSLDRWVAGRPDLLLLPPNARHTYSRNPLDLLLTPLHLLARVIGGWGWWLMRRRGEGGGIVSPQERHRTSIAEKFFSTDGSADIQLLPGFLLLHLPDFYFYILWNSTFTFVDIEPLPGFLLLHFLYWTTDLPILKPVKLVIVYVLKFFLRSNWGFHYRLMFRFSRLSLFPAD